MIAKPLTDLTKKEIPYEWKQDHQEAFEELKRKLVSYPVLAHYDLTRETQIRTDACAYGIGAILLQKIEGDWHPIAYMSRLLKKSQLNYHISDKECYAIVEAINKWKAYLDGIRFEVVTDHCSLCYLITKKDLSPRLMRYSMALQRFNFYVSYKSGKHHHDVDALSRYPILDEEELEKDRSEDEENDDDVLCMAIVVQENELMNQQRADPILGSIIQKLQNLGSYPLKKRKTLSKYRLHEGILYRLIRRAFEEQFNIVVPTSMRKEICKAYHDDILSGHASAERTHQKIMNKYYWPGMVSYIAKYVSTCESCQINKSGGKIGAPLQSIHSREVFERIGIDIVGPLPKSNNYQYIIIATCCFTRYAETRALENFQSGLTTRFLIENVIARHGCPSYIMSDQGKNFLSWLVQDIAKFMGPKWKMASAYHPQTNGLTGKTNQTLINMLTHYTKNQTKWYLALPLIQFAYNTSVNSLTKCSPFYFLYGKHPTLPIDIKLKPRAGPGSSDRRKRLEAYRDFITNGWPMIRDIAATYSLDEKANQALTHDTKRYLYKFKENEKVLLRAAVKTGKFQPRFSGPYVITKVLGETTYVIDQDGKEKIVHIDRLKRYHERSDGEVVDNTATENEDQTDQEVERLSATFVESEVSTSEIDTDFREEAPRLKKDERKEKQEEDNEKTTWEKIKSRSKSRVEEKPGKKQEYSDTSDTSNTDEDADAFSKTQYRQMMKIMREHDKIKKELGTRRKRNEIVDLHPESDSENRADTESSSTSDNSEEEKRRTRQSIRELVEQKAEKSGKRQKEERNMNEKEDSKAKSSKEVNMKQQFDKTAISPIEQMILDSEDEAYLQKLENKVGFKIPRRGTRAEVQQYREELSKKFKKRPNPVKKYDTRYFLTFEDIYEIPEDIDEETKNKLQKIRYQDELKELLGPKRVDKYFPKKREMEKEKRVNAITQDVKESRQAEDETKQGKEQNVTSDWESEASSDEMQEKRRRKRKDHRRWTLDGTKASRREEREKRKQKTAGIEKNMLNALLALSLLTVVSAAFNQESPIEWKEMKLKASRGFYEVMMELKIHSPCVTSNGSNTRVRRNISISPAPEIKINSWH